MKLNLRARVGYAGRSSKIEPKTGTFFGSLNQKLLFYLRRAAELVPIICGLVTTRNHGPITHSHELFQHFKPVRFVLMEFFSPKVNIQYLTLSSNDEPKQAETKTTPSPLLSPKAFPQRRIEFIQKAQTNEWLRASLCAFSSQG